MSLKTRSSLLAALLACSTVVAAPMTEEQLKAAESMVKPKEGTTKTSWNQFMQRLPYVAYFDHYDSHFLEFKDRIDLERHSSNAAQPTDAARAGPAAASAAVKALDDAATAATVGMAVASSVKGGMVPGTYANMASTALLGLGVAFDVLSWLATDRTDSNIRYEAIKSLRSPSLYLMKFDSGIRTEEAVYQAILDGQKQIAALGIDCEPAWYHAQVSTTGGYFIPYWARGRRFVCGYAQDEELGFLAKAREPRDLVIYQIPQRPTFVIFKMEKLDRLEHMPRLLGLEKDKMDAAARVLYEKIAPTLDPTWTVVFTAPAADGEWHAYAAADGYLVEYPAVPAK